MISVLKSMGGLKSFDSIIALINVFKDANELEAGTAALKAFSSSFTGFKSGTVSIRTLASALNGLSLESAIAILKMFDLSEAEMMVILRSNGVSSELAAVIAAELSAGSAATATAGAFATLGASIKSALLGLVTFLTTNPLGWAILAGTAIVGVTTALKKHSKAIEEAVQSAQESAESFSNRISDIEEYITKIQELREELSNGTLSEMEAYQAKQELLSIQKQLSESYGEQAAGIDLLNGKIDEQIEKVQSLSKADAERYINENLDAINKAEKEMTKILGGEGNWFKDAGEVLGVFFDDSSKEVNKIKEIVQKYSDNLKLDDVGDNTFRIRFIGNAVEGTTVLNDFMTDLRNVKKEIDDGIYLDDLFESSNSILDEANSIIEEYQSIYEKAQKARLIENDNSYSYDGQEGTIAKWLSDYTIAIKNYNDAIASGEGILEAKNNFTALDTAIQSLLKFEDFAQFKDMFEDVRAELNETAIASETFIQSIKGEQVDEASKSINEYSELLKSLKMTDIQFKDNFFFDVDGINDGTEAIKALVQSAQDMGIISMDTSEEEISSFADMLVRSGVLIEDTSKKVFKATEDQKKQVIDSFKNNSIIEWFNELSEDDKQLVYEIGVKSDDTTLWTLTKWTQEIDYLKQHGETTSESMQKFYDIMNNSEEDSFSEKINDYISDVKELKEALSSDLDSESIADLVIKFPYLSQYTNDTNEFKGAISSLIEILNKGIDDLFSDQLEQLGGESTEAGKSLLALKDIILGLGTINSSILDIETETEKFNSLYNAMKESVSGTGLSTESIKNVKEMFQDLNNYDPSILFERTENGIHLNVTALRQLQSEYETTKKSSIDNELKNLKQQYNNTSSELSKLTKGTAEYNSKMSELNGIKEQILNTQTLAAQYEGLTSAYNKWILAQSSGEQGEKYDTIRSSYEDMKEFYDQGRWGTESFRTYVDLISNIDLSQVSPDKIGEEWERFGQIIEGTNYTIKDFLADGSDGCNNFLHAVNELNSEWAHINDEGVWEINFGVGDDQKIADALGINVEFVQSLLEKMQEYVGYDFKFDSAYTSIDELKSRIEETESVLEELGQNPVEIDIYTDDENIENEISHANDLIKEIEESDIDIDIKTALLDDANAKLDALISRKVELTQPSFMKIDVSEIDEGLRDIFSLLQEYQNSVNQLSVLEAKGVVNTNEIETAKQKVEELAQKIAALPSDQKISIGLDADATIEDVKAAIKNDSITIEAKANTYEAEKAIEEIGNATPEVSAVANGLEEINELKTSIQEIKNFGDEISLTVAVNMNQDEIDSIQNLVAIIEKIDDKNTKVIATTEGTENVQALADEVDRIDDKNGTVTYSVSDDEIKEYKSENHDIGSYLIYSVNDNLLKDFISSNESQYDIKPYAVYKPNFSNLSDIDASLYDIVPYAVYNPDFSNLSDIDVSLYNIEPSADYISNTDALRELIASDYTIKPFSIYQVDDDGLKDIDPSEYSIDDIPASFKYTPLTSQMVMPDGLTTEIHLGLKEFEEFESENHDINSYVIYSVNDNLINDFISSNESQYNIKPDALYIVNDEEISTFAAENHDLNSDVIYKVVDNEVAKYILMPHNANGMLIMLVNTKLPDEYIEEDHETDGMVNWDNYEKLVDSFIGEDHDADGLVIWGNDETQVKKIFTAEGVISWHYTDGQIHGGGGGVYNNGSAFSKGNWGVDKSGVALGGELGQELVVRDGRYFTIGDNSAEFFDYKKGDIIFNADQTKEIFEKGKITHSRKRGYALAEGTAFSSGFVKFPSGSGGGNDETTPITTPIETAPVDTTPAEEFKETFDWIEIAINRIESVIERLSKKASNIYKSFSSRNQLLKTELSEVTKEIDLQQKAYKRYIEEANKVDLDESWKQKVREGTIDIETIEDEGLAEKIKEYQTWYEKAIELQGTLDDLKETQSELYKTSFDNISTHYDAVIGRIEQQANMLDAYISQSEAKGHIVSTKYYSSLISVEKKNNNKLKAEQTALIKSLNEAVDSGAITVYSEAWYEMQSQIDDVTLSIIESETAMIEYEKAIRQINWDTFDYLQESISQITKESDFLINLMNSKKMYNDKGQFTNEGISTMGMHGINYNTYMRQADEYANELQKINESIATDPNDTELIERRNELLELQQEMILAAEDEKQAIVDMVKEGIETELSSLKELIDTYSDALDAQKDLYDYQKKISSQTKNITSLQKQLSAYENDISEESKVKIQKIKVSLEEAKDNLKETEYNKYISDQKSILDDLYSEYEKNLNQRLDDVDTLISDMIVEINSNASIISDTIRKVTGDVGYTVTDSLNNIWDGDTKILEVITEYSDNFSNIYSSIQLKINDINNNIEKMIEASDKEAQPIVQNPSAYLPSAIGKEQRLIESLKKITNPSVANFFIKKESDIRKTLLNKDTTLVDRLKYNDFDSSFEARKKYYNAMGFEGVYTGTHEQNLNMLNWMKKNGYKNGVYNLKKDELAWTQENSDFEAIIRPSDGAILTPLARKDTVLNADATSNIWDMANNPKDFIGNNLKFMNMPVPIYKNGDTYNGEIELSINLPNVMNYEQFKYAMQHDKNFEKMIRSMTVDKMFGNSSLKKYNC